MDQQQPQQPQQIMITSDRAERHRRAAEKAGHAARALKAFYDALPYIDETWEPPESFGSLLSMTRGTASALARYAAWVRESITDPETEARRKSEREYDELHQEVLTESREEYERWKSLQPRAGETARE